MDARDDWYSVFYSQKKAKEEHVACIEMADNLASYVLDIPNWMGLDPVWGP